MVVKESERRLRIARFPRPCIPEPHRRQQIDIGRFRAAIGNRDLDTDVVRLGLGIFDEDVEVAVVVEDAGIDQFVLRLRPVALPVLLDKLRVRERLLRILVKHLHVGVRRGAVQIVVALLHVLAMVALVPVQTEQTLFQDGVLAVPQRNGEADILVAVTQAREAVFVPAISL